MGFYGNITNTSKTQFQFDLIYPSKRNMTQMCPKDGVYIGRYVLVDYDADSNNTIKNGYRKGELIDFQYGDFLYGSPNFEEDTKITYFEHEFKDYDWSSTDVIHGVIEGTVVKVRETTDQTYKYISDTGAEKEGTVFAGDYSFYECIGKETGIILKPDPTREKEFIEVETQFAKFKNITRPAEEKVASKDNYSKNYNIDRDYFQLESIGRGWDSTVWQKVYENGEEKYVMIAELNTVVPTFDIQADAPSMTPVTPHFDEASTNVYYKLHWQPQWGLRTRAANGDLMTPLLDKNGNVDKEKANQKIYASSGIDLNRGNAEKYPYDATTQWEKYEYDTLNGTQIKYLFNKETETWETEVEEGEEENFEIPAAIFWNDAGFDSENIANTTEEIRNSEVKNNEWDGKKDFISVKPTGWSGHQYSTHTGFKDLKAAPDTQELMVMLPSVGNAISEVWDIMYGGLETNDFIKKTRKRNKNISWENPENIKRKGLRLIDDEYQLITDEELEKAGGYKPYAFYKLNEITNDYELVVNDNKPDGVQLYARTSAGLTFNPQQANTVAGAINSLHDLMGMIIVDQDKAVNPEDRDVEKLQAISTDRIYYYPADGSYRIKDFEFQYTELDEDNFEYISAREYYIEKYKIEEKYLNNFKLTEKEFAPDMFYLKDGNTYQKLDKTHVFDPDRENDYYVKYLKVNSDELFDPVKLDTFISGWYRTSTGSYIYKEGGTVDDGVIYYTVNADKLIDNIYKALPSGTVTQENFIDYINNGLFIYRIGNYVRLTLDSKFNENETYYTFDSNHIPYWPHVFSEGENYQKDIFYYENSGSYELMKSELCERELNPFYRISQEMDSSVHPFVNSIDNTQLYDPTLIEKPVDDDAWKGPYKPENGYWDGEKWNTESNVYPEYFFITDTYYGIFEDDDEDEPDIIFEGKKYAKLRMGIPNDGFGYLFDRPLVNDEVVGEEAAYGNPTAVFKVKLIDYDSLGTEIKSHLFYYNDEDLEPYNKPIVDENGVPIIDENGNEKTEPAIRVKKWIPVTKENINEWYKKLGYRKTANEELDVIKPKRQIYYMETGDEIKYLYEPDVYYYTAVDQNENISYIKDMSLEFTPNKEYYYSNFFTVGNGHNYAVYPIGNNGHYYAPNKYYYKVDGQFVVDTSLLPQEGIQYYKLNDIYISEDTSGYFQKGASWNMNADAIPHTVTLGHRAEVAYMKKLDGYGRSYNTVNGLILELNRKLATDKPDTRDRSTLQGAINYLNDVATKVHSLTPGELPLVDSYGRIHGGIVETDEWIDVKIDPNVEEPRMIVTHEYNPNDITNSSRDLNGDKTDDAPELFNVGDSDTITFPTYKFDDMGHQVNTQPTLHTITLPYGFKTIKATNTEDDAVNGPAIEIKEEGQIADNTQDTLTFSASNRWIKFDNNTEDTVKVGHLLSPFIDETVPNKLYGLTQNEDHTKAVNDLGDLDKDNTFEVPCFQFDEAGHILEARTHTVTLPEIYNKFIVSAETAEVANMDYVAGTVAADNMNDSVTFTPGNKWIHMAVSGTNDENTVDTDVIKIAHEVTAFDDGEANKEYGLLTDETISDANNSFEIPAFKFDEAGHIRGARTHTLTLPFGFTKFTKSAHVTTEDADKTEGSGQIVIEPDTMTDNLSFGNGNKWICIDGNAENDTFTFSHYVKDFVEGASTTDLNDNGTFTVQELSWDRAGHLTASNKRTYTLPYNFKTVSVTGTSSVTENSLNGTDGTIIADTQVDTLTLLPGNKWIQLIGNAENDSVTFKHYVNKFIETTATTDNNTLANNTISTQELTWDEAGHLIGSNKRTYTLPYNFKTFTILNEGNGVTETGVATNGKLIAEDQIDEMTLTSGNRWITMIADTSGRKATIAHAVAGTASVSKGDTANQTPAFGSTFKVLSAGIDQTGHVSGLEEHTVQIPLASLNNETVGGVDSVLTKLSLEPTTGAFTTEHKNVGELLITGYSVATENSAVSATDSINSAFGKVQKALDTLNADEANENSINYKVKNAINGLRNELEAECDEEFKNFKLIQEQISDGNEETIINRVKALEEKSLPEYKDLENDGVYLMKMVNGEPTWISLASWNGGKY